MGPEIDVSYELGVKELEVFDGKWCACNSGVRDIFPMSEILRGLPVELIKMV